ncbi:unnamed protein product [Penicillium olsonii]|nr:unnamed protein product [Penicillium olsonii]
MSAAVNKAQEVDKAQAQINELLEEIDLRKFIYDDILQTKGDCEEARDELATIKSQEAQLRRLLGEKSPPIENALAPPIVSPRPSTPRFVPTPAPAPAPAMPSGGYTGFAGFAEEPHWPSTGPSPFATVSPALGNGSGSSALPSIEESRKRPRPTSGSSPPVQGSAKRSAPPQSFSRRSKLEEIEARHKSEVESNRTQYRNLINAALDDNEREDLATELDMMESEINSQFQLEKDGALARALQHEEDVVSLPVPNPLQRPSWNMPHRTQMVKREPGLSGTVTPALYIPGSSYSQQNSSSDDGFEEISADSFNSRTGRQPAFGNPYVPSSSSYSKPDYSLSRYPPDYSSSSTRPLPWSSPYMTSAREAMKLPSTMANMPGAYPGAYAGAPYSGMYAGKYNPYDKYDKFEKAFDLVRR